jgi:tRNA threonylcarbamoyladenosine biosynthesis protein TsaB
MFTMAIVLIETSTSVCSVALSENGQVIAEKVSSESLSHASLLGVYVEEVIQKAKADNIQFDAVAVSGGPGSYTGLRIGVSMAKGLCFGYGIPLISIPTLKMMTLKAINRLKTEAIADAYFCPMIDARRMEVYTALYDSKLRTIQDTKAEIITAESYASLGEERRIYIFGNGASKCKEVIRSSQVVFLDDLHPLASDMALLSERALNERQFENVAYFEPFYLKDFTATTPKNKVFER